MPVPAAVTSALITGGASIVGGLLGRKKSRPDYAGQLEYIPKEIKARVEGAKAAGLHPLAAIGMTPAGTPAMIPGQSDTGSIIGEGIQAAAGAYGQAKGREHAQKIAELDLENRKLQNDWLQSQIAASNQKTLEAQTVSYPESYRRLRMTRDPAATALLAKTGNLPASAIPQSLKGEAKERLAITSDGDIVTIPGGTPTEKLEQEIGDFATIMPDNVTRAWEIFEQQAFEKLRRGVDKWLDRQKKFLPPPPKPYKGRKYTRPEYYP